MHPPSGTSTSAERREKCGVPQDLTQKTQPELAWEMLRAAHQAAVPSVRWVTFDEHFGQNPTLLDRVDSLGWWYLAEVPVSTRVWQERPPTCPPTNSGKGRSRTRERLAPTAPKPLRVDALAAQIPPAQRRRVLVKEGEKGRQEYAFARLRVTAVRDRLPGPEVWVLFRWSLGPEPELKVYLSNAPGRITLRELAWVTGRRWPIECCFREGKQELGMADYQTRSWTGWHHHMTLVILAHHFLVRMRGRLKNAHRH